MGLYEVRLPELGEGLHEGRIEKWLVKPGDVVKEDDALAEVENDKALVELPSPVHGKVVEIKAAEGTTAVVGDILVLLEVEGAGNADSSASTVGQPAAAQSPAEPAVAAAPASTAGTASAAATAAPPAASAASSVVAGTPAAVVSAAREVLATPGVRKFAREHNVDITAVQGTGTHGKITKEDVERFLSGSQAPVEGTAPAAETQPAQSAQTGAPAGVGGEVNTELLEERIPTTMIRKRIAEAMVKSKYTAPHVTVMDEVDVSELVELRREIKPMAAERGTKITYLPFIVKAMIAAIRLHPKLNSSLDEETGDLILKHYYNIGIATDTDRGLVVPVVRSADQKNMWTIADEINDLATRARESKLTPNEMKGSTISITNIGSAGGMFFTPVINYPEVAILGVGRITEKPIMKNGQVVGGQMMALSLSFDHRVIDGALAQHFINDIKRLLENPRLLLLEV